MMSMTDEKLKERMAISMILSELLRNQCLLKSISGGAEATGNNLYTSPANWLKILFTDTLG